MIDLIKKLNRLRKWRRRARQAERRRQRLASFGINAIGVLADTKQGLFAVDPEDDFVSRRLLQYGEYGNREIQQCLTLLTEKSRVLMVGTYIGAIAVPLSKNCDSIIAIEANPKTFRFLRINLSLNDCNNVTAFNFAANDSPGKIDFILNRDNSGGSKRRPSTDDISYWYDKPEIQQVEARALDEIFTGKEFDLVFMDIEGSEYFALKGMQRILHGTKVLIVEFIPHHIEKVAGVRIKDFSSIVLPHFEEMYAPSTGLVLRQDQILSFLEEMGRQGKSDDGLIFSKQRFTKNVLDQLRTLRANN